MSAAETKVASSTAPPAPGDKMAPSHKKKEKRVKKKKKRISKHMLKSKAEAANKEESGGESSTTPKKKSVSSEVAVKDPSEASQYLKAWETKEGWKFNKNTQSWLLRHMYEADKVSKGTFTILLEYMKGLQGKDAQKRVLEEATARAQRYREYEKNKESNVAESTGNTQNDQDTAMKEGSKDDGDVDDTSYGLEHWKSLDDHDKRKEYKRARRVLETLTAKDE